MWRKMICLLLVIVTGTLIQGGAAYGFSPNTDPSLAGWWKLDDGSGTTAVDSSPGGHNGTLTNGPVWVVGHLGGALQLDGTDDYVDTGWTDNLPIWTIAIWVNSPAAPNSTGSPSGPLHRENNYQFNWNHSNGGTWPGSVAGNIGGTWTNASLGTLGGNTWFHLCGTFDGTAMKAYTNGVLITTTPVSGTPNSETNSMKLGRHGASAQYYGGLVDDARVYNRALTLEEIQAVMKGGGNPGLASTPSPKEKATDVPRDMTFGWIPGQYPGTHDVYIGTSFDDVNNATRTSPLKVSQGQSASTYTPAGLLDFGQTYYWRVDEVNSTPDAFIHKGQTWSFTAETYGYYVKPIKATASSFSNALTGPDKTIDGSGLDALDQHGTSASQMWLSKKSQTPVWIQYEFDALYSLYQMWVWNQNQMTELDNGYGAMDVTIDVSTDGTTWTALTGIPQFAQATGEDTYVHNTTVDFGGVLAKYVRLNILSNWGGVKSSGLSEVRFFYVPVKAFGPTPATRASGVAVDSVLNWRPGRTAASHEVYFGTDPNALTNVSTVTEHRYSLISAGAEYDKTYYWKINEAPKTSEGDVWSFSTSGYFVVDDFESYDDNCNKVFYAWVDGYGVTTAPECGGATMAGNGTGAAVGNPNAPYAEKTIVHGGRQSMPLFYDNPGATSNSEATRTFAVPQDWVQGGIKTLVLYFHGAVDNGAGQIYVKINNTKVLYNGKSDVLTMPLWKQWNIDLASVGGNLRSVGSLTIGVSGSGKGLVLIDDIRLYRSAPAVVQPVDPGTAGLSAYYTMDGDVKDSSGKGNNGTLVNDPVFVDAPTGFGKALLFDGVNDHVELPIGTLISTLTSATFATRVNFDSSNANSWQRMFDFGSSSTNYLFLCPRQGTTGAMRFAIRLTSSTAESTVDAPAMVPTGWHHVAVVIDGVAKTVQLCFDGQGVASGATLVLPKDLGVTTQNWLGRSQYTADGYFTGQLDEFRIYNRALSAGEVQYLAGDR